MQHYPIVHQKQYSELKIEEPYYVHLLHDSGAYIHHTNEHAQDPQAPRISTQRVEKWKVVVKLEYFELA